MGQAEGGGEVNHILLYILKIHRDRAGLSALLSFLLKSVNILWRYGQQYGVSRCIS